MSSTLIAVDIGGTTVRVGAVSPDGTVTDIHREPVNPLSCRDQVARLLRGAATRSGAERAVIGVPGRVHHVRGEVGRARNLPGTPLDTLSALSLRRESGLEITLAGDTELAALGETYFGAGESTVTTAYLTLSTGVGAAAVSGGTLLAGLQSGFQIGFLPLLGADRPMVDVLGSGQRLHLLSREIRREVRTVVELEDLARGEGPAAAAARSARADLSAAAIACAVLLCHSTSAEVLVIGGGLGRALGAPLLEEVSAALADEATHHVGWPVSVRGAALGDDAGLAGAAAWFKATGSPLHLPVTSKG